MFFEAYKNIFLVIPQINLVAFKYSINNEKRIKEEAY